MSLRFVAYLTLAMTVMVSSAMAQEEGGRRQRGGGGGPGGGMMGMGMGMGRGVNGASAILGLLRMEEVRKEVGVSEDVYKSVSESLQEDMRKLFQRDLSDEDRKKISEEVSTKSQELMEEILPPEKQQRLLGLFAQSAGAMAVINTLVAKEIGLSEEGRASLEKDLQAEMVKSGEKMREQFAGGGGERPDFAKIQEAMTKMREESSKFVEGKLSDEQKSALEKLKGEKFQFPEQRFGGFGGQGGGRGEGGRGGRGGDGGRPRGDGN